MSRHGLVLDEEDEDSLSLVLTGLQRTRRVLVDSARPLEARRVHEYTVILDNILTPAEEDFA